MRIVHTGDWHLNHRLGRINFNEFLQTAAAGVVEQARTRQAEVLLIAGDLLAGREGREQLKGTVQFLKKTLRPYLDEGGTVLVISGNHDSEAFFETLRDAFDLVAPATTGDGSTHAPGRLYVAPNPTVRTIRGRDGLEVQFVLMPFPTPRAYIEGESASYRNSEERNAAVGQRFRERLQRIVRGLDPTRPAVLVGHSLVRGVSVSDYFQPSDAEDVILETTDLLPNFAYGAFGHIHKAQPVAGGNRFWYCGSLLPLDAGESGQEKCALLAEVTRDGLVGPPEKLPVCGGPNLYSITIHPDDIESLVEKYPDHAQAIVKYCLRYSPSEHPDPYVLHRRVRQIFPLWYDSEEERTGLEESAGQPVGPRDLGDVRGTVLNYLRDEAPWGADDGAREEVIALAESLLADAEFVASLRQPRRVHGGRRN
jgi:DNA repair exonuclease